MILDVAVIDPLPLFRRGVEAELALAGHRVDVPSDIVAWPGLGGGVVLLSLVSRHAWELLTRLHEVSASSVIAVVDESAGESPGVAGLRAVRAGATSVMPRTAEPEILVRTVEATASGQAVLPVDVLTALAGRSSSIAVGPHRPPTGQLLWLGQLAAGCTVAELAGRAGYSERAMFRILRSLYREMGVESRLEAIMRARDFGWLPEADSSSARRI